MVAGYIDSPFGFIHEHQNEFFKLIAFAPNVFNGQQHREERVDRRKKRRSTADRKTKFFSGLDGFMFERAGERVRVRQGNRQKRSRIQFIFWRHSVNVIQ